EQQTATSEILGVIASSPTDLQPVLDVVAETAARLCDSHDAQIHRVEGDMVRKVASYGDISPVFAIGEVRPFSRDRGFFVDHAILDGQTIHIHDTRAEIGDEYADVKRAVVDLGLRTALAVPLLREGIPIGAILIRRTEVRPFTDKQIALLKTFADQAVIAVENVRLFKELQTRNRDLTTTLDRQTATADVLRIIAQSPTDLQPVLDAIAASAVRLCAASDAVIERLEGDRLYNAAHAGSQMKGVVGLPLPLTRQFPGGRAILDRRPIIIDDIQAVAESEYPDTLELLKLNTIHSCAEIPLLSEGKPLGSLAVLRADVRPFTEAEIALLNTFADQAVIAIENVRLFKELQSRNRDLTTALDKQTATSDILRVISQSQTDVQPVFDAIVSSGVRLLGGYGGTLTRVEGDEITLVAFTRSDEASDAATRARFPQPLHSAEGHAQAVRHRTTFNIVDVPADLRLAEAQRTSARLRGYRSLVLVPLLRHEEALGTLGVSRREPGGFTDDEIALLKTFADQ